MLSAVIKALSPHLRADYLNFFDRDAFADNPKWASCYCHFYHAAHDLKKWEDRTGEENRAIVSSLIDAGEMSGYLAYVEGKVVGWCNANLKRRYGALSSKDEQAGPDIGVIVCFTIAGPYRRQGIARELLQAACDGLYQKGATVVEAYPRKETGSEAANYHGPLQMYLDAGFQLIREAEGVVTVRKTTI